jgi:hypothetical protein
VSAKQTPPADASKTPRHALSRDRARLRVLDGFETSGSEIRFYQ